MTDIPASMKALTVIGNGFSGTAEGPSITTLDPFVTHEEIAVPQPGAGEVLVKIILANINPSDLHFIKGEYGLPRVAGRPAGFEGCGTVVKAGEGAEGLLGKRVALTASKSGAWAEYALTDARSCVPVVDAVRDEDAAAFFVNPMTAIAMFGEVKDAGSKSFILSAGASQLCKLIAALAQDEGYSAISLVRRVEQVEQLKELGAAHVFDISDPGFARALGAVLKAEKPRVFLDSVADQVCSDVFAAMPSRSEWVIYGKLSAVPPVLNQAGQFIFMEKRIRGFWLTKWLVEKPPETVMAAGAEVMKRFATGKWKTDVATIVPLAEAHAKLPDALAGANTGKVMLRP
ncbi:MAG: alcohol dehydrogenase catalytic domain-containing protein [Nitratireductor sp.]|nr:alcohol dehydrogenase catalytic domain-containing protein [Nitratireductor sp.]